MTRRIALTLIGILAAQAVAAHAVPPPAGWLTVDLSQWTGIVVRYQGQTYAIDPKDLWEALRDA